MAGARPRIPAKGAAVRGLAPRPEPEGALPRRGAAHARPLIPPANAVRSALTFVMRGRVHVITACAVCSVFSLLLFPFNYVSGALLGLATLRNGALEGALVLLGSTVLGGAFMFAAIDTFRPALLLAVLSWAPLWVLAIVLRETRSQGAALAVGGLVLAAAIVVVRLVLGDPAMWWTRVLEEFFSWLSVSTDWGPFIDRIAPLMTGIVAAGALLGLAVTLMLARWWHAVLDRPGGFGEEFRALRMPRYAGYAALVLAAVAWFATGWASHLAYEWLMILLVLFGLQGVALVHYVVKRRNASVALARRVVRGARHHARARVGGGSLPRARRTLRYLGRLPKAISDGRQPAGRTVGGRRAERRARCVPEGFGRRVPPFLEPTSRRRPAVV